MFYIINVEQEGEVNSQLPSSGITTSSVATFPSPSPNPTSQTNQWRQQLWTALTSCRRHNEAPTVWSSGTPEVRIWFWPEVRIFCVPRCRRTGGQTSHFRWCSAWLLSERKCPTGRRWPSRPVTMRTCAVTCATTCPTWLPGWPYSATCDSSDGVAEVRHDSLSFDLYIPQLASMTHASKWFMFFSVSFPRARSTYGTDKWYRQVMHG